MNLPHIQQRLTDPLADQPLAHRSNRMVEDAQQRTLDCPTPQRLGQFQVAARGCVQGHKLGYAVSAQPAEQLERGRLRVSQVLQYRARRPHRQPHAAQPKPIQRGHREMAQQLLLTASRLKMPVGPGGKVPHQSIAQRQRLRMQDFRRAQARHFGADNRLDICAAQLGGGKFTSGNIDISHPGAPFFTRLAYSGDNTRQVVVGVSRQQSRFGHRARGHHARHLAREQPLHRLVTHLFANRHVVAALDQARQVILHGVVWDTRHRDARPFGNIARGEHDIQLARRRLGILVKSFVKIAQPKKKNSVGVLAFYFQVLFANGADIFIDDHAHILTWKC